MKRRTRLYLVLSVLVAVITLGYLCAVGFYKWDKQYVRLERWGKVNVLPTSYAFSVKHEYFMQIYDTVDGTQTIDTMKKSMLSSLARRGPVAEKGLRLDYIGTPLKNGDIYYACFGCEIRSIMYFRHSWKNADGLARYSPCRVVFKRGKENEITIYRADVNAGRYIHGDEEILFSHECGPAIEEN